ncbi:hypothetical protein [Phytomonospora endophytica]|uniref:Uncharacterized protein n=1 Tax=Phytomonospora endophytica TaxID=714109 RepID=A0A841FQQ3_9ACTN|nr:hypothetical protein [Phytomonospora endophytica]MBB6034290.1 hypothetical protein [Phytomonospora endophytica]GIG66684.1 hypothetical protein Pen01_29790 [Phytomonospora endophytica]
MRFAGVDPAAPFADPAVPVLEWPEDRPAPRLPAGKGGIAVRTRYGGRWDRRYPEPARNVGVDGRPLWHGWGRMIAVVEPGAHLVEVREERAEGARIAHVAAGTVVELEYAAPRNWGTVGTFGPAPVREVGATTRPWLLAFGGLMAALAAFTRAGYPPDGWTPLALVAVAVALPPVWNRYRARADRRYRACLAGAPHRFTDGWFLGDTPGDLPDPGPEHGGLLLRFRLRHGIRTGEALAGNPHAWLGPPRPRIDGHAHRASWATWWYRLPPGRHTVAVLPPEVAIAGGAPEPAVPVTFEIGLHPGRTRALLVELSGESTLRPVAGGDPPRDAEGRISYRNWTPATEAVAFDQRIDVSETHV